jgi:hypothetical protein
MQRGQRVADATLTSFAPVDKLRSNCMWQPCSHNNEHIPKGDAVYVRVRCEIVATSHRPSRRWRFEDGRETAIPRQRTAAAAAAAAIAAAINSFHREAYQFLWFDQ